MIGGDDLKLLERPTANGNRRSERRVGPSPVWAEQSGRGKRLAEARLNTGTGRVWLGDAAGWVVRTGEWRVATGPRTDHQTDRQGSELVWLHPALGGGEEAENARWGRWKWRNKKNKKGRWMPTEAERKCAGREPGLLKVVRETTKKRRQRRLKEKKKPKRRVTGINRYGPSPSKIGRDTVGVGADQGW